MGVAGGGRLHALALRRGTHPPRPERSQFSALINLPLDPRLWAEMSVGSRPTVRFHFTPLHLFEQLIPFATK